MKSSHAAILIVGILLLAALIGLSAEQSSTGKTPELGVTVHGDSAPAASSWIRKEYYAAIEGGETPSRAFVKCRGISSLSFSAKRDSVMVTWNFHEAEVFGLRPFQNGAARVISRLKNEFAEAEISQRPNREVLQLSMRDGTTYEFVKYPGKLNMRMPQELLNTIFIAGRYMPLGAPKADIEFSIDGGLRGLPPHAGFEVGSDFLAAPDFDYMTMRNAKEPRSRDVFHWRISGDTLRLYYTRPGTEKMLDIGELYVELIRKIK